MAIGNEHIDMLLIYFCLKFSQYIVKISDKDRVMSFQIEVILYLFYSWPIKQNTTQKWTWGGGGSIFEETLYSSNFISKVFHFPSF